MSTKINKVVLKEFQETNYKAFSEGQISIHFLDEQDLTRVTVTLTPNEGLYSGGKFLFEITLPSDYPMSIAKVKCQTLIFHPNINYEGAICFNILSGGEASLRLGWWSGWVHCAVLNPSPLLTFTADEWTPDVRLVDYAHALLWLLYQPNLDSRLNSDCPPNHLVFASMVGIDSSDRQRAEQQSPPFSRWQRWGNNN